MAMGTFHKVAMAVLHMLAIRAEAPQLACRGASRPSPSGLEQTGNGVLFMAGSPFAIGPRVRQKNH
jgi:hypothetical protein